jgi:hypothetical protein
MNARVMSTKHLIKSLVLFTAMLGVSASVWSDTPKEVAVVNTPDVKVVNTPSVNVANTPGVTVNNAASNPVPIIGSVNAGPRPSTMIRLASSDNEPQGGCTFAQEHRFIQQFPDGTVGTSDFVVPPNKVLVLTSFQYYRGPSTGSLSLLALLIVSQAGGSTRNTIFVNGVMTDTTGAGAGTVAMPTGTPVGAGKVVCLDAGGYWLVYGEGYLADAN